MIDRSHELPLARQAALLGLSRSQLYYEPRPVPAAELAIMRRIDALHLDYPFAGSRMLRDLLRGEGVVIGRELVRTMMRRMCIEALYRRPGTFLPSQRHGISAISSSGNGSCCTCVPGLLPFLHALTVLSGKPRILLQISVCQPHAAADVNAKS